ncbi:uncharacterized protein LOC124919770 isoform X2 [Impatiens glandulifera]|uniref:uncharacterized protein LOC124919770 isoform X2 n=1 Tax=Impatiens glandulifera TaxID=253017 RepID=UPI001FB13C43|nr:uncharacterized protein LOC124919770 isoform X2 [Impatiens glandulifera]
MKIQPVDINFKPVDDSFQNESVSKPVVKSRLRRLFERQFPARYPAAETQVLVKNGSGEFDPSSVCLAKMVQNFIEYGSDKMETQTHKCKSKSCNRFNMNNNCSDSSEEDMDSSSDACQVLKSLVQCTCVSERNLLADTSRIIENKKIYKRKDEYCRKIVRDDLIALGYDASICKTRWEKTPICAAGEYEYVDVLVEGERMIIDIDFGSEFEIVRSTKTYKSILQKLPNIFVGKSDRLQMIISIVSEAAKQSLSKKGMHFPPWRKAEYVNAKWLSPCTRTKPNNIDKIPIKLGKENFNSMEKEEKKWELPKVRIQKKASLAGGKMVTGLTSAINDKP